MITCNGIVGLSLLVGGAARTASRRSTPRAPATALATVATLADAQPRAADLHDQHARAGVLRRRSSPSPRSPRSCSTALFVVVQTVRHRDYFLPVDADGDADADEHADAAVGPRAALREPRLLLVALVAVVGLAKIESPAIEDAVARSARRSPPSAW